MSQLTIAPSSVPYPAVFAAPLVEIAQTWEDEWEVYPELEFISAAIKASNVESTAEVRYRYGLVKQPYDSDFYQYAPLNLGGCFIRISLAGAQGYVQQFVGIIENTTTNLMGDSAGVTGVQRFVAAGGLRILQRIVVSSSVFLNPDNSVSNVGWVPPMNARDKRGLLVGNRCNDPLADGTYCYAGGSGASVWTHAQYIAYLLSEFVQQDDGPVWTVGGQTYILDGFTTTVQFGQSMNVAEMLTELIPLKYGVDFVILPTDQGFEINVFGVTSTGASFGSYTLPSNPNQFSLDRGEELDITDVQIVVSRERMVDSIQVLGKRIVVCGTLRGANTKGVTSGPSLVPQWSTALQTQYISAMGMAGSDKLTNADADKIRRGEVFREVYHHYGAPLNWTLDQGSWDVWSDDSGNIQNRYNTTTVGDISLDNYQTTIRETLSWTPLKEGWDYTKNPAVDNTLQGASADADFKPPLCLVYDEQPEDDVSPRYISAENVGIHVSVPVHDWGIYLHGEINHVLALNQWTASQLITTDVQPKFDSTKLIATIAIESDQRLGLVHQLSGDLAAGDGSVMTIIDEEAECWALLPATVVDVDASGNLAYSPAQLTILRNDRDRLGLAMAGAISRYSLERTRAAITYKGHEAFGAIVGSILTVIQQGDVFTKVGGPVTSVEWIGETAQTIVKTGYA